MISLKFVANPQIRDPTSSSTAKPVVAPSCRDGSAGQPPLDVGESRGAAEALHQGRVNVALRGPSGGVSLTQRQSKPMITVRISSPFIAGVAAEHRGCGV